MVSGWPGKLYCLLILVACHFQFTTPRPQACEKIEIKEIDEYKERCENDSNLCASLNCSITLESNVCFNKPDINPDQFCESVRGLKVPENCSGECCETLRNFVSDQLVGSSSSCITLCSFKEQTSQLCQYLKLAIEQKFPVQGIKTITTNASSNAEINPNPAEAAEKVSVVRNDTVVNTQNDKTSATVVGYTTTVANKVNEILSNNDVNSEAENEVNDNTGNENNLDETKSSNTEITNDNANLPEDVKLDAPQENIKTEEENKVDESNDSKVESPVVGEEPNVNSDDLDETDNYEDSDNSDVVNIDAAAGSHGLPYGDKAQDTMNTGPFADDDSSFMAYFLLISMVSIIAYLVFHNKQKILALILEGRRAQGSRRRSGGRVYRKLDSTVEDSMDLNRETSLKQVIY